MGPDRPRYGWPDAALAVLIFAGTVWYLVRLPHNLGPADEAVHLYEAKRLLDGEVLYRDVFEMITPGFMYLMAFLFWLFGTDVATARGAQAVMHGVTAVLLYFTCRRLNARPGLAWLAALSYLVICQAAWPIVSQHWLSTLLCVALVWVCIDRSGQPARAALVPGVVLGLLIGVQHQRGAIMAAGLCAWLAVDGLIHRRQRQEVAPWLARVGWLAAGALLVVGPMMAAVVARAGWKPVWRALVIFPLFDYRGSTHCPWGHVNYMTAIQASYTFPAVLKYLPLVLLLTAGRLAFSWSDARGGYEASRLALLLELCLFSMISIAYFPDFIHIAFIAPLFFVAGVENLEWLRRRVAPRRAWVGAVGWLAAGALLVASGYHLERNRTRIRAAFPIARSTAFGRIDLSNPLEGQLYDKVSELLRQVPSRDLFCYPIMAHLYLMTDSRNPTPYGFLYPGYSGPDLIQDVVNILATRQPPYVVALADLAPADDPIVAYVRSAYEPLADGSAVGRLIFRRKAAA